MKSELLLIIIVVFLIMSFAFGFIILRDISVEISRLDARMTEIDSHLKPHERLKNIEKFTRNFCIDGRTKACALLEPIKK